MLELTRSPCAASVWAAAATAAATAPTAAEGLGVQRNKLRSAQDAVPLPRPGSPRRHVEIRPSPTQWFQQSIHSLRKSGASLPRHEMSQDQPLTADLPPPVALIDIFRRTGMCVDHAVYNRADREG